MPRLECYKAFSLHEPQSYRSPGAHGIRLDSGKLFRQSEWSYMESDLLPVRAPEPRRWVRYTQPVSS